MNNKNVYISSCCEEGGIYSYKLTDGILTENEYLPCPNPMYTVFSENRLYILLKNPFDSNNYSGVFSVGMENNGKFKKTDNITCTKGVEGCHLLVDGKSIYVANYVSGSVIKLPDKLVVHHGNSLHPTRQTGPHTHFVCLTPDNKYVLAVDLGADKIVIYNKDLEEFGYVKAPAGNGPRHLAFSKDGSLCYCADELSSTVSVYSYADGTLTYKSSYKAIPDDFTQKNTIAAIRQKSGYVYVSNRGHDSVAIFKANGEELELVNIFSCLGNSPRDFDICENTLICTNEVDGSVTVFDITDKLNPVLTQKLCVQNALCVTICEI